jgi:arsenite oxidase large subunit
LADTILIVGANPYETQTNYFLAHMVPNLRGGTIDLKRSTFPGESVEAARMIIVDPRRTMTVATAEASAGADRILHLQIEPGSDIALLNAIARIVLARRWYDVGLHPGARRRTDLRGLSALDAGRRYTARRVRGRSGADHRRSGGKNLSGRGMDRRAKIKKRAAAHAAALRKGLIWGLKNYENIAAIVDLALLTGNVGKPGTGVSRWEAIRRRTCDRPIPADGPRSMSTKRSAAVK